MGAELSGRRLHERAGQGLCRSAEIHEGRPTGAPRAQSFEAAASVGFADPLDDLLVGTVSPVSLLFRIENSILVEGEPSGGEGSIESCWGTPVRDDMPPTAPLCRRVDVALMKRLPVESSIYCYRFRAKGSPPG